MQILGQVLVTIFAHCLYLKFAGLGGSAGCTSDSGDQEIAGLTPTRSATFFHGD